LDIVFCPEFIFTAHHLAKVGFTADQIGNHGARILGALFI
jgi:hypothetical protein